jgi:hypothetical protein
MPGYERVCIAGFTGVQAMKNEELPGTAVIFSADAIKLPEVL